MAGWQEPWSRCSENQCTHEGVASSRWPASSLPLASGPSTQPASESSTLDPGAGDADLSAPERDDPVVAAVA